jgi:putative membrane protein
MSSAAAKPDTTQLAVSRTWLAHERTLMAWVRTGTSMITFGFTIYKFFQFEAGHDAKIARGLLTPRDFALIMVSIGVVSTFAATVQHRLELRPLRRQIEHAPHSFAEIVAGLVSLFGILVLLAALFQG